MALVTACCVGILADIQITLVGTRSVPAATFSDIWASALFTLGGLGLLLALARARNWPLPRGLRAPARMVGQEWRLALLAGITLLFGVCTAAPQFLQR